MIGKKDIERYWEERLKQRRINLEAAQYHFEQEVFKAKEEGGLSLRRIGEMVGISNVTVLNIYRRNKDNGEGEVTPND